MHKLLFDKEELHSLFLASKFKHFNIFRYKYKDEVYPLNLGVVSRNSSAFEPDEIKTILSPFSSVFDNLESEII